MPGRKRKDWQKELTRKNQEERLTGNMLRRMDCKHKKKRDQKRPTAFLSSFLTHVQKKKKRKKKSNLTKLRVIKELTSKKYSLEHYI